MSRTIMPTPSKQNTAQNRWRSYLGALFALSIITIIVPLAILGTITLLSSLPGRWAVGYVGVALSPVLLPALGIGLVVALLDVTTVPVYLVRYKVRGRRALWQWSLVAFSAAYLVVGLYLSINAYLAHQAFDRVFTRDEATSLIKDCQVGELLRRPDDSTQVIARHGATANEFKSNISHVSTGSYEDLKQVAQSVANSCGQIKTTD